MSLRNQLTLFLATDPLLDSCFPGWRLPLPGQAPVESVNPFTREPMTWLTWDPGRPSGAGPVSSLSKTRRRKAIGPILPPENSQDRWLHEHTTPALLRTLPHITMNGISFKPPTELLAVLGLPDSPPARILDCPDDEGQIAALPEVAVGPLARLGDHEEKAVLSAWQAALGIEGKKSRTLIETEAAEGSGWALRRIRPLALEADRRKAFLFLHHILE